MINWDKGKNLSTISQANYIQKMEKEMNMICEKLSTETKTFDAKEFFRKIYGYIEENDRLIYTQITNYIFTLEKEEEFGVLQTNIDNVVNYMYGEQYKDDFREILEGKDKNKKWKLEKAKRTVLKLWDHLNLARRQYLLFHHKDEEYEKIVDEKMQIAEIKLSKEVNGQLISLVAIFTALSFLVFGGITSLDNVFEGAKDIPILKLVIVGSIWSFCIMNMLFVFIYFVAKISGLNISSTKDINANVIQKYPLVCWCNLLVIAIFILSSWIIYVDNEGMSRKVYLLLYKHQTAFFVIGTGLIVIIIGIIFKRFKDMITKTEEK